MILTGCEITKRVGMGDIVIDPFIPENVNPNSYNFRLHHELLVYDQDVIDPAEEPLTRTIQIPAEGLVLEPQRLYLASTVEKMGSEHFVPTYAARSSVARLGMFINLSAPLGDIGFIGRWTIQLYCLHRVRVFCGMNIGQMMITARLRVLRAGSWKSRRRGCYPPRFSRGVTTCRRHAAPGT